MLERVLSFCILFYVIVCVEIPAWKFFDHDVYFKVVDPVEVSGLVVTRVTYGNRAARLGVILIWKIGTC